MNQKPKLIAIGKGCSAPTPIARAEEMRAFYYKTECDVLARTLWGEARGEGTAGMQAVANVICNRVKKAQKHGGYWWGSNVIQVCQKPYQFSCWNRTDPNHLKLLEVEESDLYFATALRIARRALAGSLEDITNGATHYHAESVSPFWSKDQEPLTRIGKHLFYKI